MKLYVIDYGWAGAHIVIANSKEEAIKLINQHDNEETKDITGIKIASLNLGEDNKVYHQRTDGFILDHLQLEEYEIKQGLIIRTVGE